MAAIVALILSPSIFVIGYRRARRADDLKTVSDLLNKIEKAYMEIIIFRENQPPPRDKTKSENLWLRQYRRLLVESQLNLRYLTYLVRSKDITAKHLVDYCRSDMITYLRQLDGNYGWLEKYYPEFAKTSKNSGKHYPRIIRH
jgi:hypothetical protein